MKRTPAQKIRDYLRRKYKNMKEKKTKKGGLSDYSGAIYLDDIKRVEDGKKKDKKSEDKE
tara:strand:+ start:171 stop:350 length:180 start_codon:yes stop_codon:yes gene_type:complete